MPHCLQVSALHTHYTDNGCYYSAIICIIHHWARAINNKAIKNVCNLEETNYLVCRDRNS